MANYFSSAPVDFGAREIAQGYAGIANSIGQIGGYLAKQNEQKQQLAIEDQRRKSELQRQLQLEAATYGVKPAVDPKSGDFDPYATAALVKQAKDRDEAIQRQARMTSDMATQSNFQLRQKDAELGTNLFKTASGIPTLLARDVTPQQAMDPRRAIYKAEQDAKEAEYAQQRKIAGDANTAATIAARKAAQRDAFGQALGRYPGADEINANGELSPAALKAMNDAKQAAMLTPTQRNARAAVETGVAGGFIPEADRDQAMATFEQSGGRAPAMPTAQRDSVEGHLRRINGLKPLNDQVAALGADAAGTFGPMDFRVKTALGSIGGKDNPARAIEQSYKKVSSGEAFAQGGKQLTQTELNAIITQVGKPTDGDFAARLNQYDGTVRRDAQITLDQLKDSPYRFTAEGRAAIKKLEDALGSGPAATQAAKPSAPSVEDILKKYRK